MDWFVVPLVVLPVAAVAGMAGRRVAARRRRRPGHDPLRTAWSAADEVQGIYLARPDGSPSDEGSTRGTSAGRASDGTAAPGTGPRPRVDGD